MKNLLSYSLVACAAVAALATACGGGSISNLPPDDNKDRTSSTISGQLSQDASATVAQGSSGASINGATVSLVSTTDGSIEASTQTSANGSFSFTGLQPGMRLVRLSFTGSTDFDGNGSVDPVELNIPLAIGTGASATLNSNMAGVDLDADGSADAIDVGLNFQDDHGQHFQRLTRLLTRLHERLEDSNGDGSLLDEVPSPDLDCDGLTDMLQGHLNSLHGGVLSGDISALTATSLTVSSIQFSINADTRWRLEGGVSGAATDFAVNDRVLVRGFWNGSAWIATEIKLLGNNSGGGDDNDNGGGNGGGGNGGDGGGGGNGLLQLHGDISAISSGQLSLGDTDITLNAETRWFIDGQQVNGSAQFAVGDFVVVKYRQQGDVRIAIRVMLVSHAGGGDDNNDGGDDNNGGDDDDDDDNGGGDDGGTTVNFSGRIEAVTSTSVSFGGHSFAIDGHTSLLIDGNASTDFSRLSLGDGIEVSAKADGSSFDALSIKLLEDLPASMDVSGEIEAVGSGFIQVNGQRFSVDSSTSIRLDTGIGGLLDGSLLNLVLGADVSVQASAQADGSFLATLITVDQSGGIGGLI